MSIEGKRITKDKKYAIINFIRLNPEATTDEINYNLKVNFYKHFNSLKEAFNKAGIPLPNYRLRITNSIKNRVISYIINHPNATQWEINKACKTHVQEIFNGGIIEAYQRANVEYPVHRREKYGSSNPNIRRRAMKFERSIINFFEKIGSVKTQVRTSKGIADAVVYVNGNKFVLEIKDYKSKPISYSDIKQLNRYLEALNCTKGILVCNFFRHSKNKVYIGNNEITILTKKELYRGYSIIRQCDRLYY